MPTLTTFTEAQNALRPYYDNSRTPYTLDAMTELMAYLGNPQEQLKVIHIAGTSGKTSTAYYTASLLKESGRSVGLSVSPHVDNVNERLQINGQLLPEAEFCAVLSEFLDLISDCDIKPSYFELLAAMAYWEFARRGLQYAVMEVGLGGLLDATNVVLRPDKVCIITDIGLDHTEILGETLTEIAIQKAGIIHTANHVFMYSQGNDVMQVVQKIVDQRNARLTLLTGADTVDGVSLPRFQQRNLGLAVKVVDFILERDTSIQLSDTAVTSTSQIIVPARLERIQFGNKVIIIDGSHNQQKIQALIDSVQNLYPGQKIAALCGFVSGNEQRWQGGLAELLPAVEHAIFTAFHSEQDMPKSSVNTDDIVNYCQAQEFLNYEVHDNPVNAYKALLKRPENVLLVTGSFYLLNHIRPLLMEQV